MFNLVKEIYPLEEDEEKTKKYNNIVFTLFKFIHTNNHIFNGNLTVHDEDYNKRSKILHLLFKLYCHDFNFIDFTEMEAILINMY